MKLVIVESPTKGKTIEKFLGPDYRVVSSYGHFRDLPKSKIGVDVENNFEPQYIIVPKAKKNINIVKKDAEKASEVILATDEDREGEAIAYHLAWFLNLLDKNYKRIVFHEITQKAIKESLENPREIDMNLVGAQQARRILDRIVGYKLSPFLWKKVARGLSAGRVQSVAVRLVVEKEREVLSFKETEYWKITALLEKSKQFEALLSKKDGKTLDKLEIKNKKEAEKIVGDIKEKEYVVEKVEKKEMKKNPLPPFTTSTLQQEAWKRFGLTAKNTMRLAQNLYEMGFITYHRTDSLNLSEQSLDAAKDHISKEFGESYWGGFKRRYKTKSKGAQEAHEAIRPTYLEKKPDKLDDKQLKLYQLIWQRFLASQMKEALFDLTSADINIANYTFRATGQNIIFDGFLKVYPMKFEEKEIPELKQGDKPELIKITPSQHFTIPPKRYNDASLIKKLEEEGIGRPSTYAPIISHVQDKNYIEKDEQKRFRPTEIGFVVNDLLVEHFPKIVDMKFTAEMEKELDDIAAGKQDWKKTIESFYIPFNENLEKKYEKVSKKDFTEKPTDKKCPKCNSPLLIRIGKFGEFYACSNFPKCRHTESLEKNSLGVKCPKCDKGNVIAKRTKKNKVFYGCDRYPECDFASWDKPTGELCPKCNFPLVETRKKKKCSNKECDYKD